MPRPHRPNPYEGSRERKQNSPRPWLSTSVKQESLAERKDRLRREATERQAAWAALSASEKLKLLDGRPGEAQRERLAAAADKEAQAKATEKAKVVTKVMLPSEAAAQPKSPKKGKK